MCGFKSFLSLRVTQSDLGPNLDHLTDAIRVRTPNSVRTCEGPKRLQQPLTAFLKASQAPKARSARGQRACMRDGRQSVAWKSLIYWQLVGTQRP